MRKMLSKLEIETLDLPTLIKFFGELKCQENQDRNQRTSTARNIAIGGIPTLHQDTIDQSKMVEEEITKRMIK